MTTKAKKKAPEKKTHARLVEEGLLRGLVVAQRDLVSKVSGKLSEVMEEKRAKNESGVVRASYMVKITLQEDSKEPGIKVDVDDNRTRILDKGHADAGLVYAEGELKSVCPTCGGSGKDENDNDCPTCGGSGQVENEPLNPDK